MVDYCVAARFVLVVLRWPSELYWGAKLRIVLPSLPSRQQIATLMPSHRTNHGRQTDVFFFHVKLATLHADAGAQVSVIAKIPKSSHLRVHLGKNKRQDIHPHETVPKKDDKRCKKQPSRSSPCLPHPPHPSRNRRSANRTDTLYSFPKYVHSMKEPTFTKSSSHVCKKKHQVKLKIETTGRRGF
ncbi:hypothetical protein BD289DRAFT_87146 [Coniella lustricola]|uniref:Uncharacterized protein n=1 Tax=Coniella lustricola TaxID=2025994 RepID=A0A2T2ZYN4_9PEZI|nr:hypothetical protein BD289DRAFT_87146 [Coniella lustricola]